MPHAAGNEIHAQYLRPVPSIPSLPLLQTTVEIKDHFEIVETLLLEEGFDLERMKLKVEVLKSFQAHDKVRKMAMNLVSLPWKQWKRNLCECFASSATVGAELETRISQLKFERDSFANEIRTLYQFFLKADTALPVTDFVSRSFKVLPAAYLIELIRTANARVPGTAWNLLPVFTLCDIAEEICFIRGQIEATLPSNKPDRVRRVQDEDSPSQKKMSWIDSMAEEYSVYFINHCTDEQIERIGSVAAQKHKLKRRNGNGFYYVVAFKSANDAEVLTCLPKDNFNAYVSKN